MTPPCGWRAEAALGGSPAGLRLAVLRGADRVAACGWAFVALLATSSWLLAWYTLWPLAFAALPGIGGSSPRPLLLQVLFVVDDLSRYAR